MLRSWTNSLPVVLVVVAIGCTTTNTGSSKSNQNKPSQVAAFATRHEPGIIAIRNVSGRQAQLISIEEDRESAAGPLRMGRMSPVAQNLTYTFVRARDAAPLPATVRVTYSFPREPEQTTVVDLQQVAAKATGEPNEAIVFELRPNNTVTAYLDQVEP